MQFHMKTKNCRTFRMIVIMHRSAHLHNMYIFRYKFLMIRTHSSHVNIATNLVHETYTSRNLCVYIYIYIWIYYNISHAPYNLHFSAHTCILIYTYLTTISHLFYCYFSFILLLFLVILAIFFKFFRLSDNKIY